MNIDSAGRTLCVADHSAFLSSWSRVAPHLPGVDPSRAPEAESGSVDLHLPPSIGPDDGRRIVNAHLHLLHLAHGSLCPHAVAVHHQRYGAVLLLGCHGTGKTLVAIAMTRRDWHVLAGDVALLDVEADGTVAVRGGTAAFVVRRGPALRWFPDLHLSQVELWSRRPALPKRPVPVVAAVSVHVDAVGGPLRLIDLHTTRTMWLRASGHLLDRMLDREDGPVLRLLESAAATRRRVELVRTLSRRLAIHAAWGPPAEIAAQIELLATAGWRGTGT
ncbi:hypothetical protein Pth03_12080 [Planotetraspora thailandica]|uniref:Uncharacterized protein n=1 Tax=Planotetraspora thailandica TaxID=487172 RepID=A0A8J3XU35_9ACTN|nr:hypothetical protein [Planotetraspora thailandica]GII52819.1 hypothetical protein Pth03_12080 [Planotetraspora thailandica]